jgi:hypothetical protein
MQVMAFCTPSRPEWRWRIVSNNGDLVEESYQKFGSIAAAVADGQARAQALDLRDVSERIHPFRVGAGRAWSR